MQLVTCARAHTHLFQLLLLSSQALHVIAVAPEEKAVDECIFLQTQVSSTNIQESIESVAVQSLRQDFSTSVAHDDNVAGNASRVLEKLSNPASQPASQPTSQPASMPASHELSLWPLVLLVIGTVGSFLGIVLYGHLILPQEAETAVGARECFADRAKWVLSGLVCFSHLTQYFNPVIGYYQSTSQLLASGNWSHPSNQVYTLIHFFMMQSFCFYSGHYSRSYAQLQPAKKGGLEVLVATRRLQGNVLNILMVGEIMNILMTPVERWCRGDSVVQLLDIRSAEGAGWYIYALVAWRFMLPTWMCMKYPIAASFLWAAVPAYYDMSLGTAMMFSYFPFFVMGWQLDPSVLGKTVSDRRVQVSGIAFLVLIVLALSWSTCYQFLGVVRGPFYHYQEGDVIRWGIVRMAMYYIVCFLCTGSFLVGGRLLLCGNWGPLVENMSRRSLYNYLGHATVLHVLEAATGWQEYMLRLAPSLQLLFSMCMSLLVLMIMTSWPVYRVLSSVCEPNLAWLFVSAQSDADLKTSCQ